MKTRNARTLLALFALLSLSACSEKKVVTRPEIIEVAKVTYGPMPSELTNELPEPAVPPKLCTQKGEPAWCLVDAINWIEDWRALHKTANADRATVAKIGAAVEHAVQPATTGTTEAVHDR
jgi:hypothetical protein